MHTICPECQQGKHRNCDGIGYVDLIQGVETYIPCECIETPTNEHPGRPLPTPDVVPENDPGIWNEAFPEMDDDWRFGAKVRLHPDATVIEGLIDLQVENPQGEWVPIVPLPLHQFFGIVTCLCGKRRVGIQRYQEHYAYAHILGWDF